MERETLERERTSKPDYEYMYNKLEERYETERKRFDQLLMRHKELQDKYRALDIQCQVKSAQLAVVELIFGGKTRD